MLVGGVLLLLPGFLTDLVGLVFVLPFPVRSTRRWLQAMVERRSCGGPASSGAR